MKRARIERAAATGASHNRMSAKSEITLTMPDGDKRTLPKGITGLEVAASIGPRLAKAAVACRLNDRLLDLTAPLLEDGAFRILTFEDDEGAAVYRHSAGHILAQAVMEVFPGAQPAAGDWADNRYFYDFRVAKPFSAEDLELIEARMREIIRADMPMARMELGAGEALDALGETRNPFKEEIIAGLADNGEKISCYRQGNWTDLCRGPHVPSTGRIGAFRLLTTAGAYWHGDEKNEQLQRIYLTAFPTEQELAEYLDRLEQAKARDHRKLGRELDLYVIDPEIGPGLVLWTPNGAAVRESLESFLKAEQRRRGYLPVYTPHVARLALYKTSGHWSHYGEGNYQPMNIDGDEYLLKPMNCPHHIKIYGSRPRSYRDLPIRYAEFGTVYRYEQSGELSGMTRVRGFTQDDAHIFCRPDQLDEEFNHVVDLILYVFTTLGFSDFKVRVSLRDKANTEKYVGDDTTWDMAEKAILDAVAARGIPARIAPGEAAFYGPKLDFIVNDVIGREWQLGTVQVDYNLPRRFGLEYIGADNQSHQPVMIHRAPFGSMERFVAILIEHYNGDFPLWLAPTQARILPITDQQNEYAEEVRERLTAAGLRVAVDLRSEKINAKIRDGEVAKIPYMLVVGKREAENRQVSVRRRHDGDLGCVSLDVCVARLREEAAPGAARQTWGRADA